MHHYLAICVLLAGMLIAGCSRSTANPSGTVRGRVLVQGRPLAGGLIVFSPHPERGATGPTATAEIDANGEFKLQAAGKPEILSGWYRIAIAEPANWSTVIPGEAPRLSAVSGFPEALRRPDRSGLEREVVAGRENEFEFHIEVRIQ